MKATWPEITSKRVAALLRDPSSYADRPQSVRVVETHISWVFLTERYAYKLKKPVRFEFLDFSTVESRRRACLEELRLNRRLAADVYLAALPITQNPDGTLALNGHGRALDWVVQMRRLPAEKALDVLLRNRNLRREEAKSIAQHLTTFYTRLTSKSLSPDGYLQALERHIRANGVALTDSMATDQPRIRRIQSSQLRYLNIQAEEFHNRVTSGRIVDGHGDLRPEHIYLEKPPAVIDCIEFSYELRQVDIADELSFLAMECQRLGDGGLGELVLQTYMHASNDNVPWRLLAFYRAYRACVRAKVALFRAQQRSKTTNDSPDGLVGEYLDLADRYNKELGPPVLIIVGGLMGTGKSTLAAKLAESFDVEVLSTDRIRRGILGRSAAPADYAEGHYRPEQRNRIYDELFRRAAEVLTDGQSVVLDGAFLTSRLRRRAYDLSRDYGAVPLHVSCICPRELALARIRRRTDAGHSESEARTELYDRQAEEFEPPSATDPSVTIDMTQSLPRQAADVCSALRQLLFHSESPDSGASQCVP